MRGLRSIRGTPFIPSALLLALVPATPSVQAADEDAWVYLEASSGRGAVPGNWELRQTFSLSLLRLQPSGAGFGATLTTLPQVPALGNTGPWAFAADLVARLQGGPWYCKPAGGLAFTPDLLWPPRLRVGAELGLAGLWGRFGLELGLNATYSFAYASPLAGDVVTSVQLGFLFGLGSAARPARQAIRPARLKFHEAPGGAGAAAAAPRPDAPVAPGATRAPQLAPLTGPTVAPKAQTPLIDYDSLLDPKDVEATRLQAVLLNPEQLRRVYEDAARGHAGAARVVDLLEDTCQRLGWWVADSVNRPGCLIPVAREFQAAIGTGCEIDWSALDDKLSQGPESHHLRKVIAEAYSTRAREFHVRNEIITKGVTLLFAGSAARGALGVDTAATLGNLPRTRLTPIQGGGSGTPGVAPPPPGVPRTASVVGSGRGPAATAVARVQAPEVMPMSPRPRPVLVHSQAQPQPAEAPAPVPNMPPAVGVVAAAPLKASEHPPVAGTSSPGERVVTRAHLDLATMKQVDNALAQCAKQAHTGVIERVRKGRIPTNEECRQVVRWDAPGRPVTLAMQLGLEMHQAAFNCARQALGQLRLAGFSIEPRYRYDPRTGQTTWVTRQEVEQLLRQGRGGELRGTTVPDLVLHDGAPTRVQEVYDFKFPCGDGDLEALWSTYPDGRGQDAVYAEALGVGPVRVDPQRGVVRP